MKKKYLINSNVSKKNNKKIQTNKIYIKSKYKIYIS